MTVSSIERILGSRLGDRRGTALIAALHLPFVVAIAAFSVPRHDLSPADAAIVVLAVLLIGALQLRHSLAATRGERPTAWLLSLAALALAVYVPLWWFTWDWVPAQWFLMASAAMVLPRRLAVTAVVAPVVGTLVVLVVESLRVVSTRETVLSTVYFGAVLLMGAVALYASARLVGVIEELQVNRAALAHVAVNRERLRISRDLHDLLGHSLSAVSLKGDLAVRLLDTDERAARAEIHSLTDVARTALRDIQAVARDQHAVSLETEIEAAAALLRAAGIDARVDAQLPALGRPVEAVLAWAVREGTTNVLRHSDARGCSITAGRSGGAVRLEMTNDGARGPEATGSGLAGLRARAEALSGSVDAGPVDEDGFRLVVEVPERGL